METPESGKECGQEGKMKLEADRMKQREFYEAILNFDKSEEAQDLYYKVMDTETGRMTKKGKKEAGSIVKAVRGSEEQAMSDLSRSEQKQLLALTERYISACSQAIQDRRK